MEHVWNFDGFMKDKCGGGKKKKKKRYYVYESVGEIGRKMGVKNFA